MSGRTETTGMLVDVDDGSRLEWEFNPESFVDSDEANFARIGIPGMSHPRIQFSSGGERTLSFVLRLHYSRNKDVAAAIRKLRSWLYAEYSGGRLAKAPHRLLVQYGGNWEDEKWVLTKVAVGYQRFDREGNPLLSDVAVELLEYIEESRGMREVAGR